MVTDGAANPANSQRGLPPGWLPRGRASLAFDENVRASDFGGHGAARRRRLRPNRVPQYDDTSEVSDNNAREELDELPVEIQNDVILPVPFSSRSCEICDEQNKGSYILLNLNNAVQHMRIHHRGLDVSYACNACGKPYQNKHAAQCHVPKCKGPPTDVGKDTICNICNQAFKTQRGLSQHERLAHPLERNAKRVEAARKRTIRDLYKGYGKVWTKEEVESMIRLEISLQGHPQIAKQMMAHLPGKTAKQIRDKRKEVTYKALVETYKLTQQDPAEHRPDSIERTTSNSESESDASQQGGRFSIREAEVAPGPGGVVDGDQLVAGSPHPSARMDAERSIGFENGETTQPNIVVNDGLNNNTSVNREWRDEIIQQALDESRDGSTLTEKWRDLHSKMISKLTEISENEGLITQDEIDDIYEEVLTQVGSPQARRSNKRKRSKINRTLPGSKRRKKKYIYARTQDLFRKNPGLLAKYIREGISWHEERDSNSLKMDEIKAFYTSLWGTDPQITIPFSSNGSGQTALDIGDVLRAITSRDISERLNRIRKSTASGLDGIERKHIISQDIKEILRVLFNMILVSGTQPRAWNANRTVLIPKQGRTQIRWKIIDL